MLSGNDIDWFAARLAVAIHDTNAEYRMGVHDLREQLRHIPGGRDLTMRYEDGGAIQVFKIGDDEVRLPGTNFPSAPDIEAALEAKKKV